MTATHLNGNYPSGYSVGPGNTMIYVGNSAYIGGAGLVVNETANAYTIFNLGHIAGGGVDVAHAAASVYNGSSSDPHVTIYGFDTGVYIGGVGTVVNAGSILNGGPQATGGFAVELYAGGRVVNGGASNYGALIEGTRGVGIYNGAGAVLNYGTLFGTSLGSGAGLYDGGSLTNGTADDTSAVIRGGDGVSADLEVVTIANFGTIISDLGRYGALIRGGGLVTNGTNLDTTAVIRGSTGIEFRYDYAASVTNFGTIEGTSLVTHGYGLHLEAGGVVTNGSSLDRVALIEGYAEGIDSEGATSVTNFATIIGALNGGIDLRAGGFVANGGGTDRSALIEGVDGVYIASGTGLQNFGTVIGVGAAGTYGAVINATSLRNGSVTNSTAVIEGYSGAEMNGYGSNFGTIQGLGDGGGEGVSLGVGSFVNESKGLIEGYVGAITTGTAVLVNYGRIVGDGGVAVNFESSSDTLEVGAGSSFVGAVQGGGGTLELVNGMGTLTGLLAGGSVTVSGSMATTTFTEFETVQIAPGASFALAGTGGTIGAAQGLIVDGTLSGTGTLTLTAGTANIGTGASLTIAKVSQSGGTASFLASTLTVSDVWTQTAGIVTVATGDRVNFSGTGNSFSGTFAGAGTVGFTGGTDALTGTTLSATLMVINGASVTLSGTLNLTKTLDVTSPSVTIAAAGATLSGNGILNLNATTSTVIGASASATLTNTSDRIIGEGQLGDGQLKIVNGGTIDGSLTGALTINTGTNTVTNTGLIENTNTGGTTITGAVNNTGTLTVTNGTLTVDGAVTGAGTVKISVGTADFASTFTENVAFTGTTGILELAKSQTYTGQVTGLSTTGKSSLDLLDITFTAGTTKATYSGTATSGTLTVTDGTHTAHITLEGNYVGHTFTTSSDGHGGTTVVDPTVPKSGGHIVPLVNAMAGFGGGGASLEFVPPNRNTSFALIAAPA